MQRCVFVILLTILALPHFCDRTALSDEKISPESPLLALYGRQSRIEREGFHRIESAEVWKCFWAKHQTGEEKPNSFPDDRPHLDVDFGRCTVVALFDGKGNKVNQSGYRVESIDESKSRIRIRIKPITFQTLDKFAETSAWGVFVLPRSKKPIVMELDISLNRAGIPEWKKMADLKPGDSSVLK